VARCHLVGLRLRPDSPRNRGILRRHSARLSAFSYWIQQPWLPILSLLALYPAIRAAGIVAIEAGSKDPQIIVIDEVLGVWLTLAGALRFNWRSFLFAFVLFRFFDILKPPPIRLIERVPGGAGIVLDDMMAGSYAALVLFALGWFNRY